MLASIVCIKFCILTAHRGSDRRMDFLPAVATVPFAVLPLPAVTGRSRRVAWHRRI